MFRYILILLLCFELISCDNNDSQEYTPVEIQMAEISNESDIPISTKDSSSLMKTWKNVMKALENNNVKLLKAQSFDTINCQTCKSYPPGTNVEEMEIRRMQPEEFLKFYRDSFLYPRVLKYSSKLQYGIDMLAFSKDMTEVHRIRFVDPQSDNGKYSLQFYFVKRGDTFHFMGLYF